MKRYSCDAVLFDLDGTLLDTAPDLLAVTNVLRARQDLPPILMNGFRETVSRGARAMLSVGLPDFPTIPAEEQARLVQDFLDIYEADVFRETVLFPGMADTLDALEAHGIALGIVTNKPVRMAEDLLAAMGLRARFGSLLGGDSLSQRKPHPLPVLTACGQLGVEPARALFLGDDARDIDAGKAAGCAAAIAVRWGYADADEIAQWSADAVVNQPQDLLALIER